MAAPPQKGPKVVLTQTELYFPLPIVGPIENIVRIVNLENARVAYKFRAKVKGRYLVRPPYGFLHPNGESMVKFLYQFDEDAVHPDASTKDWIVLEVRFVTPQDDISSPNSYWYPPNAKEPFGASTKIVLNCVYTTNVPNIYKRESEPAMLESPGERQSSAASPPRDKVAAPQPPATSTSFIPLDKQPKKKPNEPNVDFVADRYKVPKKKGSVLKRIATLSVPLPLVLVLLFIAYAVAILEHECAPTSIAVRSGLLALGFDTPLAACDGAYLVHSPAVADVAAPEPTVVTTPSVSSVPSSVVDESK